MFPPTHCALHYSIDLLTSQFKSITVPPLMNAPNTAANHLADPRPSHVLSNEVNEKLTFLEMKAMTLFLRWNRVEDVFGRLQRKNYKGFSLHLLRGRDVFLAGTHTYANMQTVSHMQTGAVFSTDCTTNSCMKDTLSTLGGNCCILWSYHQTQHLTCTQGAAARCHSNAPKPTAPPPKTKQDPSASSSLTEKPQHQAIYCKCVAVTCHDRSASHDLSKRTFTVAVFWLSMLFTLCSVIMRNCHLRFDQRLQKLGNGVL